MSGCQRQGTVASVDDTPALRPVHARALASFRDGNFQQAEALFRQAYAEALGEHRTALAARYLGNVGNCLFAVWNLRGALSTLLKAHELAVQAGDGDGAGRISGNLASLYIQMGNFQSAGQSAERGLREMARDDKTGARASLLALSAQVYSRLGEHAQAEKSFSEAIEESDRLGNRRLMELAWDNLGFVELQAGHVRRAEHALLEAYRLRLLFPDASQSPPYSHLSELAERRGDYATAWILLDRAMEHPSSAGAPEWYLRFQAGRLQAALGHRGLALAKFREAIRLARAWREGTAPTDALRSGAANWVDALYMQFIDTLLEDPGFERAGSPAAREAFEATEERRSAALRQALIERDSRNVTLPPAYWSLLTQLRAGQTALLTEDSPSVRASVAQMEQRLQELEVNALALPDPAAARGAMGLRSGPKSSPSTTPQNLRESFSQEDALSSIQGQLNGRELLLSFHLGVRASSVWAVRRDGFEAHRLPAAQEIKDDAETFLAATQHDRPEASTRGERLYGKLFGTLGQEAQRRRDWVLASDETLLRTPLAALRGGPGKPGFLIEKHTLRVVPSALSLRDSLPWRADGTFLGVGDGIYNRADPRWRGLGWTGAGTIFGSVVSAQAAMELPRLVGSGHELFACARVFGAGTGSLLTGVHATRGEVERAIERNPAVIHFAAHVLQPDGHPEGAVIALGLNPDGGAEVLTHYDIATQRLHGGAVVMSGCSSASAPAPDVIGVLGLARAWLIAGADAVIGTRWADPDDSGAFFVEFYRNLRRSSGSGAYAAASALRAAQLQMVRSGTWRARPSYWASFYEIGEE